MRNILKSLTGGAAASEGVDYGDVAVIRPGDAARRLQVLDEFEQAGMGWIWATDPEGRLIYLSENASEKLGRPVAELLAKPLVAVFETDPTIPTSAATARSTSSSTLAASSTISPCA